MRGHEMRVTFIAKITVLFASLPMVRVIILPDTVGVMSFNPRGSAGYCGISAYGSGSVFRKRNRRIRKRNAACKDRCGHTYEELFFQSRMEHDSSLLPYFVFYVSF